MMTCAVEAHMDMLASLLCWASVKVDGSSFRALVKSECAHGLAYAST